MEPTERPSSAVVPGTLPYRQAGRPDPGGLIGLSAVASLVYVFAGFFVYWSITGSGTIGEGGRMTSLGSLIWLGPIFAWAAAYAVGPRGSLRRFWRPVARLDITPVGLTWEVDGDAGHADWSDVGYLRGAMTWRTATNCAVFDRAGETLGSVPGRVVGPDGRQRWLVDLVIESRPDIFEPARSPIWKAARRSSPGGP